MAKKLESNFINMVVVLFSISLIASAGVGYVYTLTKGPIEKAAQQKQQDAISNVMPGEFDNDPAAEKWTKEIDGGTLEFYPAKHNGELIGTAVKTFSNNGFNGYVEIMAGFNPDGSIHDYSVLVNKETPGLGSKMNDWFREGKPGNVKGKTPGTAGLKVRKDGGDVDAITAATISSRAFLDAINRAATGLSGTDATPDATPDATSGATQQNK